MRTLVWYRGKDLRTADHAPLSDAAVAGEVIPLFVLEDRFFAPGRPEVMPHRMQVLLESLVALERRLAERGSELVVVAGDSTLLLPQLARAWRVQRVVAHRAVEPRSRARDRALAAALDVPFELYDGETLAPPGALRTLEGKPFAVFTAFARAFGTRIRVGEPLPAPRALPPLPRDLALGARVRIPSLAALGLTPNPRLLPGGEPAAGQRLRRFIAGKLAGPLASYHLGRDRLDQPGTSRLSIDLKYGALSARAVWTRVAREPDSAGRSAFLNELVWREFTHSTLWDRPDLLVRPFRPQLASLPWDFDAAAWLAWTEGRTGYPVVDAAARQLLTEGFVHNRARMIAASFLTKHLLIHYRYGEAHYLRQLADADVAQNNAGWQWCAGTGCDAQPYFRVFNPVAQGEKHDPDGAYVRRHVPELARLPSKYVHKPWQAPESVLREAGVRLGHDYPRPIVDHTEARQRFLMLASEARGDVSS